MVDKKVLVRDLGQLLPLDDDSLTQMVENALKLPTHGAITEYWLGLLGESPGALDFITKFTTIETKRSPLPRAPQSAVSASKKATKNAWNQPVALEKKNTNKPRLAKSQNSTTTTSQLLDKPAEKTSKQTAKRERQRKVDNLRDLDAILKQLEIQSSDNNGVCNCMATRHPLFEVAPNCLNCGKIICVKEGLRPCSFCGKELISLEEKSQIIQLLKSEKTDLEENAEVSKVRSKESKKPKKITISSGAGVNLWKQQDSLFQKLESEASRKAEEEKKRREEAKEIKQQGEELRYYEDKKEINPDLLKAKQNLENLLEFQANSAERTKIIDQASDFEIPTGSNLNIWSSGMEKALQLKKQQKQLRKQEKKERELSGRGRKVMSISIGKDGKAVYQEVQSSTLEESDDENDEEIAKLEQNLKTAKNENTEASYSSVWDPEKYEKKWEKPKYVGEEDEDDEDDEVMQKKKANWNRVQKLSGQDGDLEELITVI